MFVPRPFAGLDRRTIWLRASLLAATLLGLLACMPLWSNVRSYPLTPIAANFPILPAPWDKGLFIVMLASLVTACWFYRSAVITFLATSLFAFCEDQNRGQPWLYMYWVALLLTLFLAPTSIAACRLAISAVYLWSGLQKWNHRYPKVAPDWFTKPLTDWHAPQSLIKALKLGVEATPVIEITIAIALWFSFSRKPAVAIVAALHLGILLILSPLGHNYNLVVWPWNLAMIALIWVLFSKAKLLSTAPSVEPAASSLKPGKSDKRSKPASPNRGDDFGLAPSFKALWISKPATVIVALYLLLPILSVFGKWDSYFSFSLYSESEAVANIFVTKELGERLPEPMRKYVSPWPVEYDPQYQGPCGFGFAPWCIETLGVPPIPEPRNFHAMFNFLRPYAKEPNELRMLVRTRGGPVIFYEGDRVEFLEPN